MKRALALSFMLAATSITSFARADDAACFSAAVDGQKLQRSGKLLAARAEFVSCAQKSCPAAVADKCAGWLHDVESATPSLSIAVRDEHGADIPATRVVIDGKDANAAVGGRALDVDPGAHVVAVEARGVPLSQNVLMHEGERARAVVFELPKEKPVASPRVDGADPRPSHAALYGAISASGLALASGVVFGVFAAEGLSSRATYHCAEGCASDAYDRVHRDFLVADVALGVAVASIAVATVLFVVKPSARASAAAKLGHGFPRPALGFAF